MILAKSKKKKGRAWGRGCWVFIFVFILNNVFSPRLAVSFIPVEGPSLPAISNAQMMLFLSGHKGKEDGQWVVSRIANMLRMLSPETPVHVWIEHGEPARIPANIQQLEERFPLRAWGHFRSWKDAFLSGRLLDFEEKTLQAIFSFYDQVNKPEEGFKKTDQPFYAELRNLASKEKMILHFERPAYESYKAELLKEGMGFQSSLWKSMGDADKALAFLSDAYSHLEQSLRIRDERLSQDMIDFAEKNPGAVLFLVRGLAHEGTLKSVFREKKIEPSLCFVQDDRQWRTPAPFKRFLLEHHALPSGQTWLGRLHLIQILSGIPSSQEMSALS